MRRRLVWLSLSVAALFSCTDWFGPPLQWARLQIIPVFERHALQQSDPDLVRIRIFIDSAGAFPAAAAVDDTLSIDPDTREAHGEFTIPLLTSPQTVLVWLDCVRSLDGAVLFSGQDTLEVTSYVSDETIPQVEIPVQWVGPRAGRIEIVPQDTSVAEGESFTFQTIVYDTAGNVDPDLPARLRLASPSDSVVLTVDRYSGAATAGMGVGSVVSVIAFTLDTVPVVEDTARVTVHLAVVSVNVTPQADTLTALGDTVRLTATALDAADGAVDVPFTWSSGDLAVAAVDSTGLVTAVGSGSAPISATTGDVTGFATVDVWQQVASVSIEPAVDTLRLLGDTLRYSAQAVDANDSVVVDVPMMWSSSNHNVAVADSTGLVTTRGEGEVTITGAARGVPGHAVLVVEIPVAAVTVAPDSVVLARGDTVRLRAVVTDSGGSELSNREITWSSSDAAVATVNVNGLVTAIGGWSATITAISEGVSGSATIYVAGVPAALAIVSGDSQVGTVGQSLADSLVVEVTDSLDNRLAGVNVTWEVLAGGGSVSDANTVTGDAGRAGITYVLGASPGAETVRATVAGVGWVEFSATGEPGSAGIVSIVSGNMQADTIGRTLADSLVVAVTDSLGAAVAGETVVWTVASGGGSLSAANTLTNVSGRTGVEYTLGTVARLETVRAAVTGVDSVAFSLTALAGPASQLSIVTEPPTTGVIGSVLEPWPQIGLEDANGNPTSDDAVAVTATIATSPGGTPTLTNATELTVGGVATFSGLTITGLAGDYTLRFDSPGLAGVSSQAVTLSAAPTTTTITADDPDPSVVGQDFLVYYSVTAGAGTPTGTVTVGDGVDSCTGSAPSGSCTLALTTEGSRVLAATYSGDGMFAGSSDTEPHQVVSGATTTTITSDDPDPSAVGEIVSVYYTVTAGAGTPTGTVTVGDGVDSCTASVAVGYCDLTLSTEGSRTLTATYSGDDLFTGSSDTEPHEVVVGLTMVRDLGWLGAGLHVALGNRE